MEKNPVTPAPAPNGELYWEKNVADRLGISRTRLRELRQQKLRSGEHFVVRGNAFALTPCGLAVVEEFLGQSGPTATAPKPAQPVESATTVPPGPPEKTRFMIVRVPVHRLDHPQRRIVLCRAAPPNQKEVTSFMVPTIARGETERPVRVRDNANFRPGMLIDAVCIGHGMWQYLGRLPRRPGKW